MSARLDTVGRMPACTGVRTVVLYDPLDGAVHHVHQAFVLEGPAPERAVLEATARRALARRPARTSRPLDVLHLDGPLPRGGPHRVDAAAGTLVPASRT